MVPFFSTGTTEFGCFLVRVLMVKVTKGLYKKRNNSKEAVAS